MKPIILILCFFVSFGHSQCLMVEPIANDTIFTDSAAFTIDYSKPVYAFGSNHYDRETGVSTECLTKWEVDTLLPFTRNYMADAELKYQNYKINQVVKLKLPEEVRCWKFTKEERNQQHPSWTMGFIIQPSDKPDSISINSRYIKTLQKNGVSVNLDKHTLTRSKKSYEISSFITARFDYPNGRYELLYDIQTHVREGIMEGYFIIVNETGVKRIYQYYH